ncbi:MAG: hypothetical protein RID11_03880 [Roseovarius sp.]|jgi:hypothetical protein|uniref:hypothetical protein n=1 Tax=Roseovarius sp. TaxID=1486281 RepID=UPI0032EE9656
MRALINNALSPATLVGALVSGVYLSWLLYSASNIGDASVTVFYSGVTALVSIASGFLAAFYFFVASRSTPFLEQIRTTPTFEALLVTTRHALVMSIILIATCLASMVFVPKFSLENQGPDWLAVITLVLLAYMFGTFWRCMVLFKKLTG